MQDPYGFLRHPRQEAGKQTVRQRVRHWREYVRAMPESQAARQARRCMDCGTPYCHRYCPVHNLIPEWNELITEAHWQRAYQQLDSTNNFPELTGRLCPAPCEDACTLRRADQPVTIKGIERAIADRAGNRVGCGNQPSRRGDRQRVAVVGSGPVREGRQCARAVDKWLSGDSNLPRV